MIRLVDVILEYSDEEKATLGIPKDAVSRGGRWYVGNQYVGKVVGDKFVPANQTDRTQPPSSIPAPTSQDTATEPDAASASEPTKSAVPSGPEVEVVAKPTKKDPSFEELSLEARKHTYTVMTKAPLTQIRSTPQTGDAAYAGKPDGFWFGVGSEWVDWTESEMPQWKGDNLYSVDIDEKSCVVIETEFDLRDFSRRYGTRDGMIDWEKVARDYKGIIIKEYIPSARHKFRWYASWDVASGCIWDASAVKQAEQQSIK